MNKLNLLVADTKLVDKFFKDFGPAISTVLVIVAIILAIRLGMLIYQFTQKADAAEKRELKTKIFALVITFIFVASFTTVIAYFTFAVGNEIKPVALSAFISFLNI